MTERKVEDLERELAFYRRQCNDLGARVLRLQEDQSRAHREARRSRTAARLLRTAFGLVNVDASEEAVGNRMLEIVLDNLVCDRAAILRRDPHRGLFTIANRLGFGRPRPVEDVPLAEPPEFYFTSSREAGDEVAAVLTEALGLPFVIWAYDPASGIALLLGNRMEANVSRPFGPDDREIVEAALGVFADIMQRRRVEEELRIAKIAAEEANSIKAAFLANLSHELRTPLNAIIGFSEIIRDEFYGSAPQEKYREYASDIHENGQHLLNLIQDILDFSRLQSGRATLREEHVDLNQAAAAALGAVTPLARTRGVTLAVGIRSGMPAILADATRIRQILINLVGNAVKFTPAGGRVEIRADLTDDGGALLQVIDTGIGIAPEDIPRAMEPFCQLENTYTRRFGGTGLGLPLCRTLAERHGGTLTIESEPGRGTTVTIQLPRQRVADGSASVFYRA
ncbi:sensor histidine kinase [Skermanella pratensis]|uniref:sensor histidine kinase n=1 Tax=Skermanella pratensis TaxID=2233999 RepID=UPI0013012E22|nr:ATP-binding protein [Skermanella pratensis]